MQPKLLIVDDDANLCRQMKWALDQDYEVFLAADRKNALHLFSQERPAVVTLDLGLPPLPRGVEEGFRALGDILQQDAAAKVIVVTGQEGRQHALEAVGQGAYDFFRKPIQLDELKVLLQRYAADGKHKIKGFSQNAITALRTYDWPGNVRELDNRIRRALIMATGAALLPEDLGLPVPWVSAPRQTLRQARAALEADLIHRALAGNDGNITHTAADLGLSRPALRELMRKHGLHARTP